MGATASLPATAGRRLVALVACLAGVALCFAGCSGPRACLRPGYVFDVLERDGAPAVDAEVTFQQVERNAEGDVVRTLGAPVTLGADSTGRVMVGPRRGRIPKPEKRIRRYTRVVVAMPDGRRMETFHQVRPQVTCNILEAEPMVLQPLDAQAPADTGD